MWLYMMSSARCVNQVIFWAKTVGWPFHREISWRSVLQAPTVFAMSSNYNSRNRAAEVMVDGKQCYLIRQREHLDDQIKLEKVLPE